MSAKGLKEGNTYKEHPLPLLQDKQDTEKRGGDSETAYAEQYITN